jgi:hypothetical protein
VREHVSEWFLKEMMAEPPRQGASKQVKKRSQELEEVQLKMRANRLEEENRRMRTANSRMRSDNARLQKMSRQFEQFL